MTTFGYALSSEEHPPADLVRYAHRAEEVGFEFASVSDHFHPWIDRQGNSPFVWGVLGAVAQATERIRLGTGVTCPIMRIHPAIVAQAAATAAELMPGRFVLGVGTGEALNEHVTGLRWPPADVRLAMLEEAITVIRRLWTGEQVTHRGEHFTVENARLYTCPSKPIPIVVAAGGPKAAKLAARAGDGLWSTGPDAELVSTFLAEGGEGKPRYAQVTMCWAPDEAQARKTAFEQWPNTAVPGQLSQDLPTPAHFEQAVELVTEDHVAERVTCGPDPDVHAEKVEKYVAAGFDHVYVHQIGPDQEGFLRFCEAELLPRLGGQVLAGATKGRSNGKEGQK